jgi:acid phosphatase (class A)
MSFWNRGKIRSRQHLCPRHLVSLAVVFSFTACAGQQPHPAPLNVPEIRPGLLTGYLKPEALPNSLALLPAPPAPDSAAFAADQAAYQQALLLVGTPRWNLAATDAQFPVDTFSCALGVAVHPDTTPHLAMLLRRSLTDAGLATYAAKTHYQRQRPFVANGGSICTPDDEAVLRDDGSYPSGHTAIGWAWALLLSEVAPERQDALLARGVAFGDSRVVCAVHWRSDVIAGSLIGAGVVAKLHSDADFLAQLEAAKAEVAEARKSGRTPSRDCAAEAAALASASVLAPTAAGSP